MVQLSCSYMSTEKAITLTIDYCCCSVNYVQFFETPKECRMSGSPVLNNLPELPQTHAHWLGDAIQPSNPLSFPSPPAFNLSQHQVLFHQVISLKWPNYWSFSLRITSSNEYLGLISFRIDWFDLLAVQGTLKSLQQHSSQAWAFIIAQLSHPYMTTGKNIALARPTFVGKVLSLLLNMLSKFPPWSKCLLISLLQSPSAVILEPKKIKYVSIVSPFICHEMMGLDAMVLVFWMLNFKAVFWLSSFSNIKKLFSSSLLSAIMVVSSAYLSLLIFLPAILISAVLLPAWHFTWCILHIS